jgi:hypothetical protein
MPIVKAMLIELSLRKLRSSFSPYTAFRASKSALMPPLALHREMTSPIMKLTPSDVLP